MAYGQGRVCYVRHKAEIERKIVEGHPKTAVYAEFGERLGMSYAQFCRHVAKSVPTQKRGKNKTRPAVSLPLPQPKRKLTEDTGNGRSDFKRRMESIKLPEGWEKALGG